MSQSATGPQGGQCWGLGQCPGAEDHSARENEVVPAFDEHPLRVEEVVRGDKVKLGVPQAFGALGVAVIDGQNGGFRDFAQVGGSFVALVAPLEVRILDPLQNHSPILAAIRREHLGQRRGSAAEAGRVGGVW